jgi:predicted LPLAT superfamily acyltransferase
MTWQGQSKGSPLGYRIFIRTIRIFGIGAAYRLLRFVVIYYILFAWGPKRNLRNFYLSVPGLSQRGISRLIRKNFNILGESIIDRFAFLLGKGKKITYSQQGEQYLRKFVTEKKPLVLISAHIGNWEIAANLLNKLDAKVNAVMYQGEGEKIKSLMKSEVGDVHFNIIPIGKDISHILSINHVLKNGEFICIHGDRYAQGSKTIEVDFFGKKAELPYGAFQLAARLKAHHSFIFTVKNGKYNYHFTATEPVLSTSPEEVAKRYVKVLEEMVIQWPEQWFNYHPFFKEHVGK